MNTRLLLKILVLIEIAMLLIFAMNVDWFKSDILWHLFNPDGEMNILSIFSGIQLFIISLILYFLSFKTQYRMMFKTGALIFIILSFDEVFALHEGMYRQWVADYTPVVLGYPVGWMLIYAAVVLASMTILLPSIISFTRNHPRTVIYIASGVSVVVFGAIVMEIIGVGYIYNDLIVNSHGKSDGISLPRVLYLGEICVEEFCEMSGMSIVLAALYDFTKGALDDSYTHGEPLYNRGNSNGILALSHRQHNP